MPCGVEYCKVRTIRGLPLRTDLIQDIIPTIPHSLRYTSFMRLRHSLAALGLALVTAASFAQQVPRPAAEFAINMNGGGQLLLSQYTGKVVVIAFMFTT